MFACEVCGDDVSDGPPLVGRVVGVADEVEAVAAASAAVVAVAAATAAVVEIGVTVAYVVVAGATEGVFVSVGAGKNVVDVGFGALGAAVFLDLTVDDVAIVGATNSGKTGK